VAISDKEKRVASALRTLELLRLKLGKFRTWISFGFDRVVCELSYAVHPQSIDSFHEKMRPAMILLNHVFHKFTSERKKEELEAKPNILVLSPQSDVSPVLHKICIKVL